MKTIALFILGAMLLIAGCATTGAGNETAGNRSNASVQPPPSQQPPANTSAPDCAAYCPTQPHVQCVGSWNISGTYPDCVCGFVCSQPETGGNTSQPPPTGGPTQPLATPTNKSVSELLNESLRIQRNDFYLSNNGRFSEKSYTWLRQMPPSGGIVFDKAPASDVLFDGESILSIQASGFTDFENQDDGTEVAYGIAIFNESRTMLDDYTGSDVFTVDYSPSVIDKKLRECQSYTKDYNVDTEGGWLLTYYFRCDKVVDK